MSVAKPFSLGLVMMSAMILAGCDQPTIHSYSAPKDPPPPTASRTGDSGERATRQTAPPAVSWTVPDGWQGMPSDQQSRLATYKAGDGQSTIEISVSEFSGNIGELHDNLNRWRVQVGLAELDHAELENRLRDHESGMAATLPFLQEQRIQGVLLDIGPDDGGGERILVAWLEDNFGRTWFIKARGKADALAPHRDAIKDFSSSFKLTGSDPEFAPAPKEEVVWDAPEHWRTSSNTSSMLTAAFEIENKAGLMRATITGLRGQAGGTLANLNRWRRQIGLPPVSSLEEQASETIDISGQPAILYVIKAPGGNADSSPGILIATQERGGLSWFFKMTGASEALDLERPSFDAFLRTIRFRDN
jgi:hypothetical protein